MALTWWTRHRESVDELVEAFDVRQLFGRILCERKLQFRMVRPYGQSNSPILVFMTMGDLYPLLAAAAAAAATLAATSRTRAPPAAPTVREAKHIESIPTSCPPVPTPSSRSMALAAVTLRRVPGCRGRLPGSLVPT